MARRTSSGTVTAGGLTHLPASSGGAALGGATASSLRAISSPQAKIRSPKRCSCLKSASNCHPLSTGSLDTLRAMISSQQRSRNARLATPLLVAHPSLSFRRNQRPAYNRTAHGTPAPKTLVDLSRNLRLLPECALGFNLRIRDVAHGDPARRLRPHLIG